MVAHRPRVALLAHSVRVFQRDLLDSNLFLIKIQLEITFIGCDGFDHCCCELKFNA